MAPINSIMTINSIEENVKSKGMETVILYKIGNDGYSEETVTGIGTIYVIDDRNNDPKNAKCILEVHFNFGNFEPFGCINLIVDDEIIKVFKYVDGRNMIQINHYINKYIDAYLKNN